MNMSFFKKESNTYFLIDLIILFPFLIAPLIIKLPYRINIFLTWEGAYRLYLGQIPFKDFGIPMGYGFWLLPAMFFYIFGPYMLSLIKAQLFINIITYFAVRGILLKLKVTRKVVTLSLIVLCLSYIVFNFWPWYNNSVVVFEFVAIYFGTSYFLSDKKIDSWLLGLAFFSFLAFFTKQDVGAIAIVFSIMLTGLKAFRLRNIMPPIYYGVIITLLSALVFMPFKNYDISYWFNYGQFPHNSRISLLSVLDYLMYDIMPVKIILVLLFFVFLFSTDLLKKTINDSNLLLLFLITVTITLQAIVIKNTSPLGNNFDYFYPFVIAFVLSLFGVFEKNESNSIKLVIAAVLLVILFSGGYWKYVSAYFNKNGKTGEMLHKEVWELTEFRSLKHIKIPQKTNNGIKRLKPLFNQKKDLKVLNMSELTFLSYEFGYTPPTQHPLWFHLGIGIFDKEVNEIAQKIKNHYYDIVLFEDIPSLNNFYPYALRDELKVNYIQKDRFLAPRKLEDSYIEVYVKNN